MLLFPKTQRRITRLAFLFKVDATLEDYKGVWTSDWTRSVHKRLWTAPRFLLQLAINRATSNSRWGAATALAKIQMGLL
jgi:hypothetical protein